jgi:hypothetical protein
VRRRDVEKDAVARHLEELRKVRETLSTRLRVRLPGDAQAGEREDKLKALLRDALDEGASR